MVSAHRLRLTVSDFSALQFFYCTTTRPVRISLSGRGVAVDCLLPTRLAPFRPSVGVFGHSPIHVGVERSAECLDLSRRQSRCGSYDTDYRQLDELVGWQLAGADRCGFHFDAFAT